MIDGLGPQARALLDAARAGLSPDAAAVRRVRARLGATTAAGGAAAGAGAAIGLKLAIVTAAILAAAGAGLVLRRDRPAALAPRLELASAPEPPRQIAAREPAAAPPPSDADLITIEAPAPVARSRRAAGELGRPVVTPGVASLRTPPAPAPVAAGAAAPAAPPPWAPTQVAAPPAIGLAREVELIDRAMAALRGGDPAEALRTVRRHAAETAGHGQLAEDAAAIEIEALCQLHDPSTNRQLEVFDARFPRSAQRSRLTSQCP